jgi:hypothetical protein
MPSLSAGRHGRDVRGEFIQQDACLEGQVPRANNDYATYRIAMDKA